MDFEIESQNIRVSNLVVPLFGKPNKTMPVKATVTNTLIENSSNIEVQLLVNGNVTAAKLLNLSGETSQDINFSLIKTGGIFNITVKSVPLPQEKGPG